MSVKILYFSWLREKVGKSEEIVDLPANVATVADADGLAASARAGVRGGLRASRVVRAALDQMHVQPTASLQGAREIAFFPPVTGG